MGCWGCVWSILDNHNDKVRSTWGDTHGTMILHFEQIITSCVAHYVLVKLFSATLLLFIKENFPVAPADFVGLWLLVSCIFTSNFCMELVILVFFAIWAACSDRLLYAGHQHAYCCVLPPSWLLCDVEIVYSHWFPHVKREDSPLCQCIWTGCKVPQFWTQIPLFLYYHPLLVHNYISATLPLTVILPSFWLLSLGPWPTTQCCACIPGNPFSPPRHACLCPISMRSPHQQSIQPNSTCLSHWRPINPTLLCLPHWWPI